MNKDLTILLMTYNRFIYTKYCLDALAQYTDFSCVKEVLVGDAGSTDGTRELLDHYDFITKIYEVPYGSVANNIRTGARLATGKYVQIVGNDILVSQDWNRKALEAIMAGERHGIRIVCYDMPDGDLHHAIHGNVAAFISNLKYSYLHQEAVHFDGFVLQPTWQAGGLWITSKQLLLSTNQLGRLGEVAEGRVYFGWWFWHLGFQNQIAVLLPRLATYMMEFGDRIPFGCRYMSHRLEEPIIKELLKENPIGLKRKYIEKGWMRDFRYQ